MLMGWQDHKNKEKEVHLFVVLSLINNKMSEAKNDLNPSDKATQASCIEVFFYYVLYDMINLLRMEGLF